MNLVEELKERKVASKTTIDTTPALVETQKLLENGGLEDLRLARLLGKKNSIVRAEDIVGEQIEMEKLSKEFGDDVFDEKDIKALCLKYNLRFLQTEHYAGGVDVVALHELKKFGKANGVAMNEATVSYKAFIMAPPSTFNLQNYKAERIKLQFPDTDPILFWKVGEGKYKMIHKWGKDFTWTRRISGFFWKSLTNRVLVYTTIATLVGVGLISGFTNGGLNWLYLIGAAIVGAFVSIAKFLVIEDMDDVKQFFTEHNWNSVKKVN